MLLKYYQKTHIYICMAKPGNLMSVAKMHRLRIQFMGCSSALVTVLRKWIKTTKTIQFVVKWLAVFCPAVTDEAVGTIKLKMGVWYLRVMTVCHVKITAENGKFHAWSRDHNRGSVQFLTESLCMKDTPASLFLKNARTQLDTVFEPGEILVILGTMHVIMLCYALNVLFQLQPMRAHQLWNML